MEVFVQWIGAIGSLVHWLTGWLVHPTSGGCCQTDKVKENIEKIKK